MYMSECNTLLDPSQLDEGKIHSKTSFYKYLLTHESSQNMKTKENIWKSSYTNKLMEANEKQVIIISKRLPLKPKQKKAQSARSVLYRNSSCSTPQMEYTVHNKFLVEPLQGLKRYKIYQKNDRTSRKENAENPELDINDNQNIRKSHFKLTGTKSLRLLSKSGNKQKVLTKKRQNSLISIIESKENHRLGWSYSELLKQLNTLKKLHIKPIPYESHPLLKIIGNLLRNFAN